ncbi:uncharacterized protein LOC126370795 [Pectinophora gossypiella]|uniref:uncharacterized protein LOC126370795 n=1 Tax=Pectinophora gossypiella TaxID=13191 RepID=UPI00214E215F|nr:uncharacterized protein LOC126370795 [Pectinophora gossypiella]
MWTTYYILISLIIHQTINVESSGSKRHKRYLLFTTATQWGVFLTISIPLHPETTVSVAWFFEANYYTVANATYFEPLLGDIDTMSRKKQERSIEKPKQILTRSRLYTFIESMLEKHGYPGRPCLLRAICENSTSHFLHNGVLGDVLHLMLTPSTSMSEEELEDCYYEAEYLGLDNQCGSFENECPSSPLEMISMKFEDFL